MQLPSDLRQLLTEQITREFSNEASYRAMASVLDARNLVFMAEFMRRQADGENVHAKRFLDYFADRGDVAILGATTPTDPELMLKSTMELFTLALSLEEATTHAVKNLNMVARSVDMQTETFLIWYLLEQIEEERVCEEVVMMFTRYPQPADGMVNDYLQANMSRLFP